MVLLHYIKKTAIQMTRFQSQVLPRLPRVAIAVICHYCNQRCSSHSCPKGDTEPS